MAKKESTLEKQCCAFAAKLGVRSIKLESVAGIPDRMHLFPNGKALFVEYKRPDGTGTLSEMQILWGEWLKRHGFLYMVCSNLEEFKSIVTGLSENSYAVL